MASVDESNGKPLALPGRLWVVATPIGNLGDLSPRAMKVLGSVAAILAEDTRSARKLLARFAITSRTVAFHEHNEERLTPRMITRLFQGEDLALVSEAGTPLLSDPGYRLVRACRERGIPVLPVPGPSSVTAALSVAGLPPYPFTFMGFLPPRSARRRQTLQAVAALPHTLVFFLSPHRFVDELADCGELLGSGREGVILAELTKLHERASHGTLADLIERTREETPRGEYTLVVGPPRKTAASTGRPTLQEAEEALQRALEEEEDLAAARRTAARQLGISRRDLYALLAGKTGE